MLTKYQLDKFVENTHLEYNHFKDTFECKNGEIKSVDNYLLKAFQGVFNYAPKSQDLEVIKDYVYNQFNFDKYAYKSYFKRLSSKRNRQLLDELQKAYNKYLAQISTISNSKQVLYITGESGSYKTTYAKILATKLFGEDEIYITASGNNPFDEYYGEKCIIMDDFRDSNLSFSDLLKLLDNNTSSNVGARYSNKSLARCQLIILTSVKPLNDLYNGVGEDRFQLYRRCKYFKINDKILYNMIYNTKLEEFLITGKLDVSNEIDKYCKQNYTKDVLSDFINNFNEIDFEEFI